MADTDGASEPTDSDDLSCKETEDRAGNGQRDSETRPAAWAAARRRGVGTEESAERERRAGSAERTRRRP